MFSRGPQLVAFMKAVGAPLLPWQAEEVTRDLVCDESGRLINSTVLDIAPRRNGKTHKELNGRATFGMLVLGERRITYTAHHGDTVRETFENYREFLLRAGAPDANTPGPLWRYVRNGGGWQGKEIRTGKGDESVTFANGSIIKFRTRTKEIGRGLECETLMIDEALQATYGHMSILTALRAAAQAAGVGQTIYMSSAGHGRSIVLNDLAKTGRTGANPRMSFNEHAAPLDADPADPETWKMANPSLGSPYLSLEFLEDQYHALGAARDPTDFGREHLGWFSDSAGVPLIPPGQWEACRVDRPPQITAGPPVLAVEMQQADPYAAIVAAVPLPGGRIWVEPLAQVPHPHQLDPAELADIVAELASQHGAAAIVIDDMTGATLIDPLKAAARCQIVPASAADVRRASAVFLDHLAGERIEHAYDGPSTVEMIGAAAATSGDGGTRISRARSTTSTARPVATLLAVWGLSQIDQARRPVILTA